MTPDIFEFIDYATYMEEWFNAKKVTNPKYSYRTFADQAGFKARGYIADIIKRRKQLSIASIQKVANAMKMELRESEYFELLVLFKISKNANEKSLYWEKIQSFNGLPETTLKIFKEFKVLEHWYIAPIREVVTTLEFNEDYNFLSKQLTPEISPTEARDAVQLLKDLKIIIKKGKIYEQHSQQLIILPDELHDLAVKKFQRDMLSLAQEALTTFTAERRTIQTLTFGSNSILNEKINQEIQIFIARVSKLVEEFPEVQEVREVNIQNFPLSKRSLHLKEAK